MKKNESTLLSLDGSRKVIDGFGGTYSVARILGVTPQSVCRWRREGMPLLYLYALRGRNPDLYAIWLDRDVKDGFRREIGGNERI